MLPTEANRPMHPADAAATGADPAAPALPAELYLLFVGPEEPSWTMLTLQLDRCGCTRPRFHWCSQWPEAARTLNQERFDCLVIDDASGPPPTADECDAPPLLARLAALRTGGCFDPCLILTDRIDDAFLSAAAQADCELLITRQGWRSAGLIAWIGRALARHVHARDRLEVDMHGRNRRQQDAVEIEQMLDQRRRLSVRLGDGSPTARWRVEDDPELAAAYLDLLRSVVLADVRTQGALIVELATALATGGASAKDVFDLHLATVETMLRGLGGRSARHVLQRTDLAGWELLVQFGLQCSGGRGFRQVGDSGLELGR